MLHIYIYDISSLRVKVVSLNVINAKKKKNVGMAPIVLNLYTFHSQAPAALSTGIKRPVSVEDKAA